MVRILVADDNAAMRRSLRKLLEAQDNWRVCSEASNGKEAVDKMESDAPDVILLDFQMPVMNGLEAARIITRRHPAVPILMVSLHDSPYLADAARQAGIGGTCAKTDIGCVVEAVEVLLGHGTYYKN
jgi:DNA-binding NarL/FixJ family response regulator